MYSGKKAQHDFPKMRGGGDQRPFGTFPKIHPFWNSRPSLIILVKDKRTINHLPNHDNQEIVQQDDEQGHKYQVIWLTNMTNIR